MMLLLWWLLKFFWFFVGIVNEIHFYAFFKKGKKERGIFGTASLVPGTST
jgi:hypothetical protein